LTLRPHRLVPFLVPPTTSPTETYTLSLHDALPIWKPELRPKSKEAILPSLKVPAKQDSAETAKQTDNDSPETKNQLIQEASEVRDRKSTRLNSSHVSISYAVFCLKKKNKNKLKG